VLFSLNPPHNQINRYDGQMPHRAAYSARASTKFFAGNGIILEPSAKKRAAFAARVHKVEDSRHRLSLREENGSCARVPIKRVAAAITSKLAVKIALDLHPSHNASSDCSIAW
jgi:hypothetical protein